MACVLLKPLENINLIEEAKTSIGSIQRKPGEARVSFWLLTIYQEIPEISVGT